MSASESPIVRVTFQAPGGPLAWSASTRGVIAVERADDTATSATGTYGDAEADALAAGCSTPTEVSSSRIEWEQPVWPIARQITEELDAAIVRPVYALLGHDLGEMLEQWVDERAPLLAAQLLDGDDQLGAGTVRNLMMAIWSDGVPDDEWWDTPLGRRVAALYGIHDSETVTISVAGAMLGVGRSRVYQLLDSGKLERHPEGGVTRASVGARLAGG